MKSLQPAKPSSINGLLRQHCRESLYVDPLRWTERQLDLLGLSFTDRHCISRQQRGLKATITDKVVKGKLLVRDVVVIVEGLGSMRTTPEKAETILDVVLDSGFRISW